MVAPSKRHSELKELIEELREEANATDSDVPGNVEYRIKHEVANRLSEILK